MSMTMQSTGLRFALALLLGILVAGGSGCAHKKPPPAPPSVASPQRVQEIRNAYWRAYPDSRVGLIDGVDAKDRLVSVTEVNGGDFREGQTVVIIDEKQKVIANGTIVRIFSPDHVHVTYQVAKSGREPVKGDMMVRIPPGATTL